MSSSTVESPYIVIDPTEADAQNCRECQQSTGGRCWKHASRTITLMPKTYSVPANSTMKVKANYMTLLTPEQQLLNAARDLVADYIAKNGEVHDPECHAVTTRKNANGDVFTFMDCKCPLRLKYALEAYEHWRREYPYSLPIKAESSCSISFPILAHDNRS